MAGRVDLSYTSLKGNDVIDLGDGDTLDATNGHSLIVPRVAIPGEADSLNRMFLYVINTGLVNHTVTIKAGVSTDASYRGGTGDLVCTIKASAGGGIIGPLEEVRFAQADGSIWIDLDAGFTGSITAYMWPERW